MSNYKKSHYAINKVSKGIVYRNADGSILEITFEKLAANDPKFTKEDFDRLKQLSDELYHEEEKADNLEAHYAKSSFDEKGFDEAYSVPSFEEELMDSFGRIDFIGDYLERIFPFLGVRFISVNDGYDSDEYKGTTAGMDVVMKYIVYSSYSHDLSQKIKTVMQAKHRKGQWVGSHAPYGYMKDENNKNHLLPNPDTAHIVRKIFDLALIGKKVSEIAKMLNDAGIETPAAYFRRMNPNSKKHLKVSTQSCWDTMNVRRILQKKLYTGTMVSNTKKWKSISNARTLQNDESEWIVVPDCHEAIVSNEEFEMAQHAIKKINKGYSRAPRQYLLRSLIACGVCGRAMSRYPRTKRKYYVCNKSNTDANAACPIGEKFYEDELERIIVQDVKDKLELFVDNQKKLREADKATHGTEANIRSCIAQLEKALNQKVYERNSAYERYVDEVISRDDFLRIKAQIADEELKLHMELEQYEQQIKNISQQKNGLVAAITEKAEDFVSRQTFTNEMLLYFIDKVKLYSGGKIEIVYRFQDLFEDTAKTE